MGVLGIKDVSYYYNKDRIVVDDVSQSFESGKMYVILGSSGCGKTMLLSLLGGLDIPKKGQVLFEKKEIQKKELTARQEALPVLEKLGLSKDEAKRNV